VFFFFAGQTTVPIGTFTICPRPRGAHFFSHPVPAVFRLDQGFVEKIGKIIDVPVRPQDHVTTPPTIAAVWPAFRHKFFSSETDAPAPACPRLCKNFYPDRRTSPVQVAIIRHTCHSEAESRNPRRG